MAFGCLNSEFEIMFLLLLVIINSTVLFVVLETLGPL